MLAFVMSLKSEASSRNWPLVSRLCERTLRSVCAQTCPDFRVFVGCRDVPELSLDDPRLEFVSGDFPLPDDSLEARREDKARKMAAALARALEADPSHVMLMDADDCVSRRLADFVVERPRANGWYIRTGYFHMETRSNVHLARRRFHRWCGSSHIVRADQYDWPGRYRTGWYPRHFDLVERQAARGTPLRPLPFAGAVYNVSHGDNFHDYGPKIWPSNPIRRLIRGLLFLRPLRPQLREEFGLHPLAS